MKEKIIKIAEKDWWDTVSHSIELLLINSFIFYFFLWEKEQNKQMLLNLWNSL